MRNMKNPVGGVVDVFVYINGIGIKKWWILDRLTKNSKIFIREESKASKKLDEIDLRKFWSVYIQCEKCLCRRSPRLWSII